MRRPEIKRANESSVPGLYIVGDLAGAPVIKLAMAQGYEVIDHLSTLPELVNRTPEAGLFDVLVVGAGAAGLNAALAAKDKGLSCMVLEKGKVANTIENFPEGKWVYAEPDTTPPVGKLWLDGAQKEDLVQRWQEIVTDNDLDVHTSEALVGLERQKGGHFLVKTEAGEYRARKIVLATGQRGNPRTLGAPGEDQEHVYHKLYSPRKYKDESTLVVGGGNSAIEAALVLAEKNKVVLSYRKSEFSRIFKDNRLKLDAAVAEGRIEVLFGSTVEAFEKKEARLSLADGNTHTMAMDHGFVLIGAELPVKFLKSLGIRLENEWTGSLLRSTLLTVLTFLGLWLFGGQAGQQIGALGGLGSAGEWGGLGIAAIAFVTLISTGMRGDRWSWLGLSFFTWYSIYGIKRGVSNEFWPYKGWGYDALTFAGRGWSVLVHGDLHTLDDLLWN